MTLKSDHNSMIPSMQHPVSAIGVSAFHVLEAKHHHHHRVMRCRQMFSANLNRIQINFNRNFHFDCAILLQTYRIRTFGATEFQLFVTVALIFLRLCLRFWFCLILRLWLRFDLRFWRWLFRCFLCPFWFSQLTIRKIRVNCD